MKTTPSALLDLLAILIISFFRSSVNRLSNHDRNQLIARDLTVEKKLGQERLEPNSPPETDIESPEGNDIGKTF